MSWQNVQWRAAAAPVSPDESAVGGTPGGTGQSRHDLAWKLNRLFKEVHPRDRGEWSPEEVAKAISEGDGDVTISPAYIYMLRKGTRDNPTKKHLEALAGFFGVTPSYFFDERVAEEIEQQLDLIAAFRDGTVRQLAARAADLSPRSLGSILRMVDVAREIEGLPVEAADVGEGGHTGGAHPAGDRGGDEQP